MRTGAHCLFTASSVACVGWPFASLTWVRAYVQQGVRYYNGMHPRHESTGTAADLAKTTLTRLYTHGVPRAPPPSKRHFDFL